MDHLELFVTTELWKIAIANRPQILATFRRLSNLNRAGCRRRGHPVRDVVPIPPGPSKSEGEFGDAVVRAMVERRKAYGGGNMEENENDWSGVLDVVLGREGGRGERLVHVVERQFWLGTMEVQE